jgi:uncharacterized damage-inducible protein DinB
MPRKKTSPDSDLRQVLLETYAANGAMNQLLLAHLDPRAWRALPPAKNSAAAPARTLAEIFCHIHNNRLSWLRRSAPDLKCPRPLDPARATIAQTRASHRQSSARCLEMLRQALSSSEQKSRRGSKPSAPRVTIFSRGSWAPDWPAGATMFAYMLAHEAHHRGQIILLARQLGFPLPDRAAYGIWRWEKLWKQAGLKTRPR